MQVTNRTSEREEKCVVLGRREGRGGEIDGDEIK
jgi:hypothetical protein